MAGLETVVKNAAGGDNHTDTVLKIRLWDKLRALELLMKHFRLVTDLHEHKVMSLEDLVAGSWQDENEGP